MANIRTTSVALLVDREVDRNLRTTSITLLVDRSIDRLNCVSGLYLIVDIEPIISVADIHNQVDEFVFSQPSGNVAAYYVIIGNK